MGEYPAVIDLRGRRTQAFPLRRLGQVLVLGLVLGAVSLAAVMLSSFGHLTAVWATNALAMIALLRGPREVTWRVGVVVVLYAGLIVAIMAAGAPLGGAMILAGTNLVEIGVALGLLFHFRLHRADLTQPGALAGFMACVGLAGPAVAALSAAPLVMGLADQSFVEAWWEYFAADALGAMIITPFGMVLTRARLRLVTSTPDRLWAAGLFMALSGACVFLAGRTDTSLALLAPLVMLATLRFGVLGAASSVLWSSALAVGLSLAHHQFSGSFADGAAIRADLVNLQMGLAVLPLSSLPIAAVLAQRDRALVAATAAGRARAAFLTNMSHEIRTPLNGVIGMAELLSRSTPRPADQEIARTIRTSGEALQRILCDLLDLARMESGEALLDNVAFDLGTMSARLAEAARGRATGGVSVGLDLPAALPLLRQGPERQLAHALDHLLENAAKVTTAGSVTLRLRAGNGDGDGVIFTVEDDGPGFDLSTLGSLTAAFAQADESLTRRLGGAGLGLAIVRHLVEDMGGTLAFSNRPEGGARVEITVPLTVRADASPAPAPAPPDTVPDARVPLDRLPRILMAEDNPTNRKVIELILAMAEVELVAVENGAEAVAAFADETFDVVLMDVQMPVMDGLTAVRQIRAIEAARGNRTPILMLTANALPEHRAASAAAGADAHLTKPITAPVLFAALDQALSGAPMSCDSRAA